MLAAGGISYSVSIDVISVMVAFLEFGKLFNLDAGNTVILFCSSKLEAGGKVPAPVTLCVHRILIILGRNKRTYSASGVKW